MSIFISIIIFGIGDIPYIDALFFGSGASTQSGLNTIDINNLRTGQQVMLMMGAMLCNPIVTHSFVVFVRLYMFEKRFKDIVKDARALRRTNSKTSTVHPDPEANDQLGVRGRAIQTLCDTGRILTRHESELPIKPGNGGKDGDSSDNDITDKQENDQEDKHELARSHSDDELRLPRQLDPEQHIRYLENQRNPEDGEALHIPSPREFDRGGRPQNVSEMGGITRRVTSNLDNEQSHEQIFDLFAQSIPSLLTSAHRVLLLYCPSSTLPTMVGESRCCRPNAPFCTYSTSFYDLCNLTLGRESPPTSLPAVLHRMVEPSFSQVAQTPRRYDR